MSNEMESARLGEHLFTAPELLSFLDGVADCVTVQDKTGALIYANPAAAQFIGFESPLAMVSSTPETIRAKYELLNEYGGPLPLNDLPGRRALAGETEAERMIRFRFNATGEERWSMVRARPVFDTAHQIRYVINIWNDVTERMIQQKSLEENAAELEEVGVELEATVEELQMRTHEAEAAQKRAEYVAERQRFLAEAGRMLAASLEPEETLRTIANLAVPKIADWAAVNLITDTGKPRQLAVAHADPEKVRFALELQKKYPPDDASTMRIVQSGKSELYREIPEQLLEQTARDAEHLRLIRELNLRSAMVVPLKIRDHVLGTITFIGAESGRLFDNDDLEFAESLAARSALAITNARLYKEAQEANRVKSDFLAVMSHELRTPLTAIFGYTELLSAGITGPIIDAQKTQLDRIHDSAAHLLGIIEDILNYARSEAGRDQIRLEKVRLADVINESLALVSNAASRKKLALEQVVQDGTINTDRVKFRQILVNLLGNAVKFTDKGLVRITARCTDENAIVEVTDTGPGIAEGDLKRVFEPFRQLEGATTRTSGGTGLGLAVTRRFADLLGGTIDVRSRPGEGTTFIIIMPLETQVQ